MHHTRHTRKSHTNTLHYIILFLLMLTAFFAFVNTTGRPQAQRALGVLVGATYFFWGIFHHRHHNDLNYKIVLEYLALSLLGVGLFWALVY